MSVFLSVDLCLCCQQGDTEPEDATVLLGRIIQRRMNGLEGHIIYVFIPVIYVPTHLIYVLIGVIYAATRVIYVLIWVIYGLTQVIDVLIEFIYVLSQVTYGLTEVIYILIRYSCTHSSYLYAHTKSFMCSHKLSMWSLKLFRFSLKLFCLSSKMTFRGCFTCACPSANEAVLKNMGKSHAIFSINTKVTYGWVHNSLP